jgi:hypothetical protein
MPVRTFGVEAGTDGIASQLHKLVGLVHLAGPAEIGQASAQEVDINDAQSISH